jgi:hypothetical protein
MVGYFQPTCKEAETFIGDIVQEVFLPLKPKFRLLKWNAEN